MKKLMAMLLAAAMVTGLVTSSTAYAGEIKSSRDTLVMGHYQDCPTFDPIIDTNGTAYREMVYDRLFYLLPDGTIEPALATEWTWEDDLHLALTLREGVTFSNGNAFTAEDVIFSLQRYKDGPMGQYYDCIEKMEASDDTHMTIEFNTLPAAFMIQNSTSMGFIFDKEYTEANIEDFDTKPMGTGPYVLDRWTVGDSCIFKANDSYWGEKPYIANVILRYIAEPTQRMIELQSGGIDLAINLSYADTPALEAAGFQILAVGANIVQTVFLNTEENHPLYNEDLRKALASCIDRVALTQGVTNGAGTPCFGVVAPGFAGFFDEMDGYDPYPQDFDKAKEYLAAAGYPDGITLTVVYNDKPTNNSEVEILQNWFAKAGITLNVTKGDFATALGIALDRAGAWDMFLLGNGGVSSMINFQFYDRAQGAPFAKLTDEEGLSLIEKIYATTDNAAQIEAGNVAQKYMADHVLSLPLFAEYNVFGCTPQLKGAEVDAGGNMVRIAKLYFE